MYKILITFLSIMLFTGSALANPVDLDFSIDIEIDREYRNYDKEVRHYAPRHRRDYYEYQQDRIDRYYEEAPWRNYVKRNYRYWKRHYERPRHWHRRHYRHRPRHYRRW